MKIGKSSSSQGYVLADPQDFQARGPLDGAEPGQAWTNLIRAISAGLAVSWFEEYGAQPFTKWVQESLEFSEEGTELLLEQFAGMALGEHEVVPTVLRSPELYGDAIPLHESSLAQSILQVLDNLNVRGDQVPCLGLGGWLVEAATPYAWMGGWGTSFGDRTQVWFEIRKDSSGVERAIFFSNLLVSTRAVRNVRVSELIESIVIGRWSQTLLYIGETPFPSSFMSFSRDMAMESLPVGRRPQPLAWIENFALTASMVGDASNQQVSVNFSTYPLVLKHGYVIPALPAAELSAAVSVAVDSLVSAASVVQDGFLNARNDDSLASFDQVFFSEFDLLGEEIGAVNGYARWIPEPLIGSLVRRSTENYYLTTQADKSDVELQSALQWIADNGAGSSVAAAINTLAYSFLIPNGDYETAAFYLRQAIDLDIMNESTNAMANYGSMLLASGEREEGERILLEALERPDKFAEGEANYLLGLLYRDAGDASKAETHFERAVASEDPQFSALARLEMSGVPQHVGAARVGGPKARFCSNCGSKFTADDQRFCIECGSSREA